MADRKLVVALEKVVSEGEKVEVNWLEILVGNLKIGYSYEIPLFLWSKVLRPIAIELHFPKLGDCLFGRELTVENYVNKAGKAHYKKHRLQLGPNHHDECTAIRVGWPADHPKIKASDPFWITAHMPSKTGTSREAWRESGFCPECGTEGGFIRTTMVCPQHGPYGGF
jgi:hypothetical protein